MTKFTVTVNDTAVNAQLDRLAKGGAALEPVFADIGEALKIRIDQCFAKQQDWDGQPWAKNELSTIQAWVKERGGFSKKTGKLNAKGQRLTANKKVLQGITGALRLTINWSATPASLTLGSPMAYAAIHNFGGDFKAWGKTQLAMPKRQFFPSNQSGQIHPAAQAIITNRLQVHLNKLKT